MAQIRRLWDQHPNLLSWLVLAVGMVDHRGDRGARCGLQAELNGPRSSARPIGLAGLCVWIISWEDATMSRASSAVEATSPAPVTSNEQ